MTRHNEAATPAPKGDRSTSTPNQEDETTTVAPATLTRRSARRGWIRLRRRTFRFPVSRADCIEPDCFWCDKGPGVRRTAYQHAGNRGHVVRVSVRQDYELRPRKRVRSAP